VACRHCSVVVKLCYVYARCVHGGAAHTCTVSMASYSVCDGSAEASEWQSDGGYVWSLGVGVCLMLHRQYTKGLLSLRP
jgi:hypothetical protein